MVSKEISSYEYYTFSSIPRAGTNFVQTSVLLYGNGGDYSGPRSSVHRKPHPSSLRSWGRME
jgi:hypothetical protein